MAAVFLALVNPGDEVIVFEPFYENYGPDAILAEGETGVRAAHAPDWRIDEEKLRAAFTRKTKAIIVNTPHNPTGRVFTRDEISLIAELCVKHDVFAITDEIYEHIIYAGDHHVIATWPGMARAHDHDLRPLQNLQLHRLAARLRDRAAEAESVRDPQGPRFSHGRRAGAAAGRRRGRHGVRRRLLQSSRARLPRAARFSACASRGAASRSPFPRARTTSLADFSALCDLGDVDVRDVAHARCRRGDGAGLELLSARAMADASSFASPSARSTRRSSAAGERSRISRHECDLGVAMSRAEITTPEVTPRRRRVGRRAVASPAAARGVHRAAEGEGLARDLHRSRAARATSRSTTRSSTARPDSARPPSRS